MSGSPCTLRHPRWEAAVPEGVVAVNVSGDGRLVIIAAADGTLRWYAASKGRELLRFLPHADQQRWIAWTPSGYYDASASGDDLLGWQVDRGPGPSSDQPADFFRIALFRQHLYRPDLTARVLFTQDEARALEETDAESGRKQQPLPIRRLLPPVVTLLSPEEGTAVRSDHITLRVSVRSPSGEPVTAVRPLAHGRLTQVRGLVVDQRERNPSQSGGDEQLSTLQVAIPEEDCTVAVVAETALAKSEGAVVHLRWEGRRKAPPRPDLHLLAVGISNYRQRLLHLDYAAKDARDLAQAFVEQEGKRYGKVQARMLTDQAATRGNILAGLAWLRETTRPSDVAVLFLAGHGTNAPSVDGGRESAGFR